MGRLPVEVPSSVFDEVCATLERDSTFRSYQRDVIWVRDTTSWVGGVGYFAPDADVAAAEDARLAQAFEPRKLRRPTVERGGRCRWRMLLIAPSERLGFKSVVLTVSNPLENKYALDTRDRVGVIVEAWIVDIREGRSWIWVPLRQNVDGSWTALEARVLGRVD